MSIDFNVQLHNTNTKKSENVFTDENDVSASGGWLFDDVDFKTTITERNTSQQSNIIDDTYSLRVNVHAVQDQMPGGMAKVLDIFTNAIQEQAKLMDTMISAAVDKKAQAATSTAPSNGKVLPPKQ